MKTVIGIDIGGANLKFAGHDGRAWSCSFPMWKQPERVRDEIVQNLRSKCNEATIDALAVTVTGELADCFVDRAEGVEHLVSQAVLAATDVGIDRSQVFVYGVDGNWYGPHAAIREPDRVAAANWHALASYVGQQILRDGLLVDIGSTTTDIVPIANGGVATDATTDFGRLRERSLVYVGCRRTPVCALVDGLEFRGDWVPVMNEWFATIDDGQLLLGLAGEEPSDCDTADGKPRTRAAAANRLARMIGLDRRHVTTDEATSLARQVVTAARQKIAEAIAIHDRGQAIVLSGHGPGMVGKDLLNPGERSVISLAERWSPKVARCAPSYAVACLLHGELSLAERPS